MRESEMKKQQKCMQEDATRTALAIREGKREGKRRESKVKEEDTEKIYEDRRERGWDTEGCNDNVQALLEDIDYYQWEELTLSWNIDAAVDEQMPYWYTSWCPLWDLECLDDLYNDVLWEDDIWDLKAIKDVPDIWDLKAIKDNPNP